MGMTRNAGHMFQGVHYNQLDTPTLKYAMTDKIAALGAKIEERQGRVADLMAQHGITDAAFGDLVMKYMSDQKHGIQTASYMNSAPAAGRAGDTGMVPAGALANLIREKELITSERGEIDRMRLIVRMLKDRVWAKHPTTGEMITVTAIHTLDDDEIDYLGIGK